MPYETPEEREDREAAESRRNAQAYWSKKQARVVKTLDVDNKDVVIEAHTEPGTCPCGACPINEYGRCATCEDERAAQDEHNDAIIAAQP